MSRVTSLCLNVAASSKKCLCIHAQQKLVPQNNYFQKIWSKCIYTLSNHTLIQESEYSTICSPEIPSEHTKDRILKTFPGNISTLCTERFYHHSQDSRNDPKYARTSEKTLKSKYNQAHHKTQNIHSEKQDERRFKTSKQGYKKRLKPEDSFGSLASDMMDDDFSESFESSVGSHNERFNHDEEDGLYEKPHKRLSRRGRKYLPSWYSKRIIQYGNKGQIKEAIIVLDKWMLTNDRVLPNSHNFSVLLGYLGKVGYTAKAFKIYRKMKELKVPVKPAVYTSLFNACANSPWSHDGLQRATVLLSEMRKKNIQPNLTIYKAIIKAFGMCGDLRTAFAIMDEAAQRFQLDAEIFSPLLMACISDKKAGFQHAIKVWQSIRHFGIKPDVFLYNLFLRSVRDCGIEDDNFIRKLLQPVTNEWAVEKQETENVEYIDTPQESLEAKNDFNISQTNKFLPNYNPATSENSREVIPEQSKEIELCKVPNIFDLSSSCDTHIIGIRPIKTVDDRLALIGGMDRFLHQLKLDDVTPDIRTFTQLLDVIPSDLTSENKLLSTMKDHGITPDIDMLNLLIRKRSLRKDDENAQLVLKLIDDYGLHPNIRTFGCLAMSCRTTDEGLQLLKDIEKHGMEASVTIFGILAKTSGFNFRYKMILIKKMQEHMIKPTPRILENMEKIISAARKSIIDKEHGKELPYRITDLFIESFQQFLEVYEKWLAQTEIETPIHPWETFRDSKKPKSLPDSD